MWTRGRWPQDLPFRGRPQQPNCPSPRPGVTVGGAFSRQEIIRRFSRLLYNSTTLRSLTKPFTTLHSLAQPPPPRARTSALPTQPRAKGVMPARCRSCLRLSISRRPRGHRRGSYPPLQRRLASLGESTHWLRPGARPLLSDWGGGGGGSFWGCLRTGQATHPPKLTHPPTHPPRTPPTPPVGGGLFHPASYVHCTLKILTKGQGPKVQNCKASRHSNALRKYCSDPAICFFIRKNVSAPGPSWLPG